MAHSFGSFYKSQTAGDYITNKKTKLYVPRITFNESNLNRNLITKLNLLNVTVIDTNPSSEPPYLAYNIDPSGALFGNSVCGLNNYNNYLECNPPT
jgi:hypothetical protein